MGYLAGIRPHYPTSPNSERPVAVHAVQRHHGAKRIRGSGRAADSSQETKKPQNDANRFEALFSSEEGLVRVELTMADLQSAALATWLQPPVYLQPRKPVTTGQVGTVAPPLSWKLLALYRLGGV